MPFVSHCSRASANRAADRGADWATRNSTDYCADTSAPADQNVIALVDSSRGDSPFFWRKEVTALVIFIGSIPANIP